MTTSTRANKYEPNCIKVFRQNWLRSAGCQRGAEEAEKHIALAPESGLAPVPGCQGGHYLQPGALRTGSKPEARCR